MRIPRILIEGAEPGKMLELEGPDYHHIARVLRRSPGDPLVVLDGRGRAFQGVVERVDPRREVLSVRVGEPAEGAAPSTAPIAVALGVPRGDGFELAIRWGSEMGISRLIPLLAERCAVKIPAGEERARSKIERWRKIARESAEQCRRPVPLLVEAPSGLAELLERTRDRPARWIAVPGGPGPAAAGLLKALGVGSPPRVPPEAPRSEAEEVLVLVGPEGGFSPGEIDRARSAGCKLLGFPTPILKTPTAVAYLAALGALAPWLEER